MSASLRFLAVAVIAWAGVRAATLGLIPGIETVEAASARPAPPIVPTEFPPLNPVAVDLMAASAPDIAYPLMAPLPAAIPARFYYPATPLPPLPARYAPVQPLPASYTPVGLEPGPVFYSEIPELEDWSLAQIAAPAFPGRRSSSPVPPAGTSQPLAPAKLDRLRFTAWALLRGRNGTDSLASGGTLGGSQAGARLTYAFDRRIAASLRTSSPVGGSRGGEVAAGLRLTPFPSIPIAITAERRQRFGRLSTGRNAFALFVEGGVYQRPLPWNLSLDAYAQAGVVGARSHDLFADGAFTVMRPIYGRISGGFGMWGGAQPGLYRVDAGPRLSMRVRHNMRVDVDWRQRLAGTAEPGSGPALTLAANF